MRRAARIAIILVPLLILARDGAIGRFTTFRPLFNAEDLREPFWRAIVNKDAKAVRVLLRKGADVNARDIYVDIAAAAGGPPGGLRNPPAHKTEMAPLHLAIRFGHKELSQRLCLLCDAEAESVVHRLYGCDIMGYAAYPAYP
jgi:hypothetical protein